MLQPQQFIRVIENIITEIGTFVKKCYLVMWVDGKVIMNN